jgi:hypothetical protein
MSQSNSAEIRLPVDGIALSGRASRNRVYAGLVLSGLAIVSLVFDTALKVLKVPAAAEGTTQLHRSPDQRQQAIGSCDQQPEERGSHCRDPIATAPSITFTVVMSSGKTI